ncbi:STK_08120 family protein [Psychroflexus aestuariivivens]|uniref:STK_08120 family protein n=1 Tax=Psychroflexus aestuariivivens TaxID=1795040 RepID=UPI000FDAD8D6|nr:STK_08120 family protein [Psychroflexus aestuariivivens]
MNLESPKVKVEKSQQEVFNFLKNIENFEKIMPESIEKFEMLDQQSFLFQLKGMPVIKLRLKEITSPNQVILAAASDKLPFTLTGNIEAIDENSSEVQLVFEGDFNSMMAMMIKNPIKKFIATLSENLSKI